MRIFNVILAVFMSLVLLFSINLKSFITINYFFNKTEITELFCINKEKPKLKCNGKCYLAKEVKKIAIEEEEKKPLLPISNNKQLNEVIYTEITELTIHSLADIKNIKKNYLPINSGKTQLGHISLITPPPKHIRLS